MPPRDFRSGVALAFDRDESKELFGAREPEMLRRVLDQQLQQAERWQTDRAVDCERLAESLQAALSECELPNEALRPALDQTLLGGRPLGDDAQLRIRVVRPDIVPHIAAILDPLSDATVLGDEAGEQAERLARVLSAVRRLYRVAAAEKSAVVFAIESE